MMSLARLRRIVRPLVPVAIIENGVRRDVQFKIDREINREAARRKRLQGLGSAVEDAMAAIAALTPAQCLDARFLEHEFIPALGLNDEVLHEQPPELAASFGKGLHIWQYPNQLAGYLVWLARNSSGITSFMEIGCRWGGMFILVSEWIRKNGGDLRSVTAVDLIEPSPFITTWFELMKRHPEIQTGYIRDFSTSAAVAQAVDAIRPDMVFIDADHSLRGALGDHMLVRGHARIIAHHDIHSQAWPDTTLLWETLKVLEAGTFAFAEFTDQYPSVEGTFLGIGAMVRR
jgi:hypothetical protein